MSVHPCNNITSTRHTLSFSTNNTLIFALARTHLYACALCHGRATHSRRGPSAVLPRARGCICLFIYFFFYIYMFYSYIIVVFTLIVLGISYSKGSILWLFVRIVLCIGSIIHHLFIYSIFYIFLFFFFKQQ